MNLDRIRLAEGEQLLEWARGRRVGTIEVLDGTVSVGDDHNGVPSLFVELVVSDPPPGHATWVMRDYLALRDEIDAKAYDIGIDHWHVDMHPQRAMTRPAGVDAVG